MALDRAEQRDPLAPSPRLAATGRWSRWAWLLLAVGVLVLAGWWSRHPEPLPAPGAEVEAATRAGAAVYVGTLAGDGHTRHVTFLDIEVDGGEATPLVCRDGGINVTSDPAAFCSELVPAAGATIGPHDQLVLEVSGDAGSTVTVAPVEIAWREGLQWGRDSAGSRVTVTVAD